MTLLERGEVARFVVGDLQIRSPGVHVPLGLITAGDKSILGRRIDGHWAGKDASARNAGNHHVSFAQCYAQACALLRRLAGARGIPGRLIGFASLLGRRHSSAAIEVAGTLARLRRGRCPEARRAVDILGARVEVGGGY